MFTTEPLPDSEIVTRKSSILLMCQQLLAFNSTEEEVYFLKIEALWLLTNLAYCEEDTTMLILSGDLDPAYLEQASSEALKQNVKFGQSLLLQAINTLVIEKMD